MLTCASTRSGTTLFATPPAIVVTETTSRNTRPSRSTSWTGRSATGASASIAAWIALSPCHGRALCAARPRTRTVAWRLPLHPTSNALSVGSRTIARAASRSSGDRSSAGSSRLGDRHFLATEEQISHVDRATTRAVLREREHHREAAFHVGSASAAHDVAVDGAGARPRTRDRVDMTGEQDQRRSGPAVGQRREHRVFVLDQPQSAGGREPPPDDVDDRGLVPALRRDLDQGEGVGGESRGLARHASSSSRSTTASKTCWTG